MKHDGGVTRWLLVLVGVLATLAGAAAILSQATSGAQPWTDELSDNFVFAKAIPFALGLGVLVGLLTGRAHSATKTPRRAGDGAIRRFSPSTVIGHWIIAVGFLLALPTGMWQYLGGIVDVTAPIPLYLIYRIHYIGGALILFSTASFVTYWWLTGDRSLLVPKGQWTRHVLGLAHELPRPLGELLAIRLGLDTKQRAPQTERFTFYEKVVSFPSWAFVIALITITGLLKAMRYVYPIPGPVLFWASTLHVAAMVMIAIKLLDHLRYTFPRWPLMVAMVTTWVSERRGGRQVKRSVALLGLLWALGNLLVSYLFITSAFVAKTAAKEGFPAQVALLLGGVVIEVFAVALAWQCFRLIVSRDVAES